MGELLINYYNVGWFIYVPMLPITYEKVIRKGERIVEKVSSPRRVDNSVGKGKSIDLYV